MRTGDAFKEKIHDRPLWVRTHMVGNVCMHVDDLSFTGTKSFLDSSAQPLKKTFQTGSLDTSDVMFGGQRLVKQWPTVAVHRDLRIDDLHGALIPTEREGYGLFSRT